MYGKIFQTLFTGSLYGRFEATVTHIACIVLSDREGYLNYTPAALAGATGFPLDVIEKGLAELQEPDIRSRSKEHEGRRVIPIEPGSQNGWFVVNKAQYRDMQDPDSIREQTRERVRKHREKRSVTDGNASQRHTDTNPDADADTNTFSLAPDGAKGDGFKKPQDKIWEALLQACGIPLTATISKSARGAYNRAAKDLRDMQATPESIHAHARAFSKKWPAVSMTPTALVRRWNECVVPGGKR